MPSRSIVSPSKSNSITTAGSLPDHPAVMTRIDGDDLRRLALDRAPIGILDVEAAAGQEADVRVHAQVGADDRLHVDRPAEADRVNHPLHARRAGRSDFELDVANLAAHDALQRRGQWVAGRTRRLGRTRSPSRCYARFAAEPPFPDARCFLPDLLAGRRSFRHVPSLLTSVTIGSGLVFQHSGVRCFIQRRNVEIQDLTPSLAPGRARPPA